MFSIQVSSGGGAPSALAGLTASAPPGSGLFYITVPLKDVSIVDYNTATGSAGGVEVGQSLLLSPILNLTCPLQPSSLKVGTLHPALDVSSSTPRAVTVTVAKVTPVSYTGIAITLPGPPAAGAPLVAAGDMTGAPAGGGSAALSGAAASDSTTSAPPAGALSASSSTAILFSASCGAVFGPQTFACGPGMEGSAITYACPRAGPTPTCLYFNKATALWSSQGCSVHSMDLLSASMVCACDHFADFGTRYAALDNAPVNVFVAGAPALLPSTFAPALLLFVTISAIVTCMWGGGLCGARARARL